MRELTAPARGGVSVLAVRGPGALARVQALCPAVRAVGAPRLVRLEDGGEELDELLVLARSERDVELHLHGSPALVRRVRQLLVGARTEASPAARTLEERAEEALGAAPCEAGARILLDQAEGALRRELEELLQLEGEARARRIEGLLELGRRSRRALVPARVVLAGPVNAGKSTLFNALCGERRAIVSADAGTTRDVLAQRVQLGPWPVDLHDAPGERAELAGAGHASADPGLALEARGLELARGRALGADLVLWLAPAPAPVLDLPPLAEPARWRLVVSRADLMDPAELAALDPGLTRLSAREEPEASARAIEGLFVRSLGLPGEAWSPGRAVPFEDRQLEALERALHGAAAGVARGALEGLLEASPSEGSSRAR